MKAGTAASVIAYTYLHRHKEHLRGSVGTLPLFPSFFSRLLTIKALSAVSDEETGGRYGAKFLLENER